MSFARNGRTILLGEDDPDVRKYLETALRWQGYTVEGAQNGAEVIGCLQNRRLPVSAVVLDVLMPGRDGLDALREIRRIDKDLPVIMISGAASRADIADAMRNGASDFLAKPISPEGLRQALDAVLAQGPPACHGNYDASASRQVFFGVSAAMQKLQDVIGQIGWSEAPVLIQGETGVGKEVLARQLHAQSPRLQKPILKLNCAALPSELVESELFGYERGAFTGAFQKKLGMFELADRGSILLDEIGDMDFKLQAKLLQVLQDHEFQPLGAKQTVRVDVRIIAATHRDLEKAIAEETFREDLYYRLNVITLHVPPLRDRREDILPMAEFLIRKHTVGGEPAPELPSMLQQVFLEYHWPGNVRELENVIRKFIILRDVNLIWRDLRARMTAAAARQSVVAVAAAAGQAQLQAPLIPEMPSLPADGCKIESAGSGAASILERVASAKVEAERKAILSVLHSTNWNRRKAAKILNLDYKAFLYRMSKLSIK